MRFSRQSLIVVRKPVPDSRASDAAPRNLALARAVWMLLGSAALAWSMAGAAALPRPDDLAGPEDPGRQRRLAWAVLVRRSFGLDVLACPPRGLPARCNFDWIHLVQAPIVKAVADVKAEELQTKQQRAERKEVRREPRGLGIRERLEPLDGVVDHADASVELAHEGRRAQPPVTVNVHAAPAAGGSFGEGDLTKLARMVVAAPRPARRSALESLVRQLSHDLTTWSAPTM
ncbi:MAG: hypothetical protein EXR72_27115 [Myxococcales bacterium]|nr:hypothetical protein [Myxococcales bacterium]